MLTFMTVIGAIGFLFRGFLSRWLVKQLPDRKTRHFIVTAIIAAFAITFVVRLGARFLG